MKVLVFKDIKNNRWTVWNESKTKHLGYKKDLCLVNCTFIVEEEKRQRVLKTKKRFPHAFILGTISSCNKKNNLSKVSYNPFKDKMFKCKRKRIQKAKKVTFNSLGKVFVVNNES